MNLNKLSGIDWAKIATAASILGVVLGTALPAATVGSIDHYGGPIITALAGLVGVGTAFLVSLRKQR